MKQRRHKILFILLTLIAMNTSCQAIPTTENISLIENHIFGYENKNLNENERLSKIEKFVYGSSKQNSQSSAQRLKTLNEDLGLAPDEKAKVASSAGQPNYDETDDYANEPADPTAQYPIVDNIEQTLLSKTYTSENIYKRLDRLEQQAYGKTIKGSLSERVERLSTLVKPLPKKDDTTNYFADNNDYNYFSPDTTPQSQYPSYPTDSAYIGGTEPSGVAYSQIAMLEQEIFGRTYPQNDPKTRISRLEKELLHKEFSQEPDDIRIERLATVTDAQRTAAPYKENRLMQHVATGVQIGSMILMLLAMIL